MTVTFGIGSRAFLWFHRHASGKGLFMRGLFRLRFMLVLPMLLVAAAGADAGQVRSSTTRGLSAVTSANGFSLRPVGTGGQYYGDLAPTQLFEIVRPSNQRISIGRLFTSCTCVVLEADKTTFEPGEPAIVRLRNIHATPPQGQMYAVYVQLNSPIRTVLRHDTFVRSSQFIPAAAGEAPTRGNVKADGIYTGDVQTTDNVELIVPKADNYIPDTSEYTLRKRAEEEAAKKGSLPETAEAKVEKAEKKGAVKDAAKAADKAVASSEKPVKTETKTVAATTDKVAEPDEIAAKADKEPAADKAAAVTEKPAKSGDKSTGVATSEKPATSPAQPAVVAAKPESSDAPVKAAAKTEKPAEKAVAAVKETSVAEPDDKGIEKAIDEAAAAASAEVKETETVIPETVEIITEEIVVVEDSPKKPKLSDRAAARKEAMKRSMRAAEEMTNKAASQSDLKTAKDEADELGREILKAAGQTEETVVDKADKTVDAVTEAVADTMDSAKK